MLVGLDHLMKMEEVQSFMSGTSAQALHADRSIYQPGALHKVRKSRIHAIISYLANRYSLFSLMQSLSAGHKRGHNLRQHPDHSAGLENGWKYHI